jgi:hypothetical protein
MGSMRRTRLPAVWRDTPLAVKLVALGAVALVLMATLVAAGLVLLLVFLGVRTGG